MHCNEIRHIIDQVTNREIPENALCDIMDHIESCDACSEYLESSNAVSSMLRCCSMLEPLEDDPFTRFDRQLDEKGIRISIWEIVISHPFAKPALVAGLVMVALLIGGFATINASMNTTPTVADQKVDTSLIRMPNGAILMKTSDGREIIFLDSVLEADGKLDDVIRELKEVMESDSSTTVEEFHFASN